MQILDEFGLKGRYFFRVLEDAETFEEGHGFRDSHFPGCEADLRS